MSGHRLLALVAAGFIAAAVPSVASSAKQDKAPPPPDAFVGMETCASCHEETVKAFKLTLHARGEQSCESCHGPGKEHVEAGGDKSKIRNFKTLTPPESAGVCMDCHNKGGQKHWVGSSHDAKNVACATCHNPHPKGPVPKALLAKPQQALCTGCHLQRKAQLMRAGHMPLREGKLQCTSCHNPHGTPNDKMIIQASVNQNCYSCHAEKRGPFLWEHAPVRENCMNCHEAHGTVNEKMLRVKAPLLCQQCHQTSSHPGPAYPAQSRYAFNQGCLHCHTAIHGSVHPSGNRFFR